MKEAKNTIIFTFILSCLLFFSFEIHPSYPKETKQIIAGRGFDNYQIGVTSIQTIINDYGKDFKKIEHNGYSTELIYENLGLSFSYHPEVSDTIFAIEFFHPFSGITDKGIILNISTMADVEIIHDSLDWYITKPFLEWYSEHPGIEYAVPRDTSKPTFPMDEEFYKKMKISRIVVLDNFEDFDED